MAIWKLPSQLRNFLSTGTIRRQIHAAEQGMTAPSIREFVGALRGNKKFPTECFSYRRLRDRFAPGQLGGLVLRVVLKKCKQDPDLQVEKPSSARIHRQH